MFVLGIAPPGENDSCKGCRPPGSTPLPPKASKDRVEGKGDTFVPTPLEDVGSPFIQIIPPEVPKRKIKQLLRELEKLGFSNKKVYTEDHGFKHSQRKLLAGILLRNNLSVNAIEGNNFEDENFAQKLKQLEIEAERSRAFWDEMYKGLRERQEIQKVLACFSSDERITLRALTRVLEGLKTEGAIYFAKSALGQVKDAFAREAYKRAKQGDINYLLDGLKALASIGHLSAGHGLGEKHSEVDETHNVDETGHVDAEKEKTDPLLGCCLVNIKGADGKTTTHVHGVDGEHKGHLHKDGNPHSSREIMVDKHDRFKGFVTKEENAKCESGCSPNTDRNKSLEIDPSNIDKVYLVNSDGRISYVYNSYEDYAESHLHQLAHDAVKEAKDTNPIKVKSIEGAYYAKLRTDKDAYYAGLELDRLETLKANGENVDPKLMTRLTQLVNKSNGTIINFTA